MFQFSFSLISISGTHNMTCNGIGPHFKKINDRVEDSRHALL